MATYDLEEQEQLAEIKAWWKMYGNLVVNILLAVLVALVAWLGWTRYQGSQASQAAMVFNGLQNAVQAKDSSRIKMANGELVEKFGGTNYASLGALITAKAMIDAGDAKTAKLQLVWVAEHGKDELRDLARLRLAAVLLDEKAYDEALKQLEAPGSQAFAARFADTRGDVLAAQGKKPEALIAYQLALTKLDEAAKAAQGASGKAAPEQANSIYRELVQQKLDAQGGSK